MLTSLPLGIPKKVMFIAMMLTLFVIGCRGPVPLTPTPVPKPFNFMVRIQQQETKQPIEDVKVTLQVAGQPPIIEYSDSEGIVILQVAARQAERRGHLTVEKEGYRSYTRNLTIQEDHLPNRVELSSQSEATAIIETATAIPTSTDTPPPSETSASIPTAIPTTMPTSTDTPPPSDTPTSIPTATPTTLVTQPPVTPTTTNTRTASTPVSTSRSGSPVGNPISGTGLPLSFENFGVWVRGDEANGSFTRSTEQVYSGSASGKLEYDFSTADNDYVVFLQNNSIGGTPNGLQLWVYGDSSGHFLNAWIRDAGGQIWQVPFGRVGHTGWQPMTGHIDTHQNWPWVVISGGDDPNVDYPISFRGFVLDDRDNAYVGHGVIYLDDLTAIIVADGGPTPTPSSATPTPEG